MPSLHERKTILQQGKTDRHEHKRLNASAKRANELVNKTTKNHKTSEDNYKLPDNAITKRTKTRGNDWEMTEHNFKTGSHDCKMHRRLQSD